MLHGGTDIAGGLLSRWEVRCKLAGILGAIISTAWLRGWEASVVAGSMAVVLAYLGQLPWRQTSRALMTLGVAAMPFLLILPWTLRDERPAWWEWGPLAIHPRGVEVGIGIAWRMGAIGLLALSLVQTTERTLLLAALRRLGVPASLVWVVALSWQYAELLGREYRRLRAALRTRGFRLRSDWHSYRTLGHISGALLVHSAVRAERVAAAMQCRGFHGHFHTLGPLRPCCLSDAFAMLAVWIVFVALLLWDRCC